MKNLWDDLAEDFNTNLEPGQIDDKVADNILIAWPVLIELIRQQFEKTSNKSALDFGCGTGGFTKRLAQLGFATIGFDNAEQMIAVAKQHNSATNPRFSSYPKSFQSKRFDLITSIMVFQFIEDIADVFAKLTAQLNPGGLLAFVVFNPAYIARCLELGIYFKDFDDVINPKNGYLNFFGAQRLPIYIRTAKEYNQLLQKSGFEKVLESYPEFTKAFKQKYPEANPVDVPEYLILGYKRG